MGREDEVERLREVGVGDWGLVEPIKKQMVEI